MSHTHVTTVTHRLGAAAATAVIASAVWTVLAAPHVGAQGMPTKTCVDPRTANQVAQPGDTVQCTVSVAGAFIADQSFVVQPTGPAGAAIPRGGCAGAAGSGYATTAGDNGRLGSPGGACIYTVSSGTLSGNGVIGTERVAIPVTARAGSSLAQQTQECLIAGTCGPMIPMIADGPG